MDASLALNLFDICPERFVRRLPLFACDDEAHIKLSSVQRVDAWDTEVESIDRW